MDGMAVPPREVRRERHKACDNADDVVKFLVLAERAMSAVVEEDERAKDEHRGKGAEQQGQQVMYFQAAVGEIPAHEEWGNTGENLNDADTQVWSLILGDGFLPGDFLFFSAAICCDG